MIEFPQVKQKSKKVRYKKPDSIKQLEADYLAYKKSLYPAQPYLAKKLFRDDTANGLTKCLQAWAKVNQAHFQRMNVQGQYDAKLKRYRRSGATKGVSDTLIVFRGKTLNIEIKIGKDKQSDAQKKIQSSIEASGGIYWIVKSYDRFLEGINKI